jgi:CheY-like chemotaxis protein
MSDQTKVFGDTAKSLARNPLGIIALFIVLVYGFAALVTASTSFTPSERIPLIYFMVFFPVVVLAVFTWLVIQHWPKLFAPVDYGQGSVEVQLAVVAALTAATTKANIPASEVQLRKIVEVARTAGPAAVATEDGWKNHILWVDDRPENNKYERQAFEAMGLRFTLALSTDEAFDKLSQAKFAAIISDMGRREGPREGYVLLDRLRKEGDLTPLFFYAASNAPEHKRETREHGGQGCTNNAQDLFQMVTKAVIQRQSARGRR